MLKAKHLDHIEILKHDFQNMISAKNEYIFNQEKGKDALLSRINFLESEQARRNGEYAKLLENFQNIIAQNNNMQVKMEELKKRQDLYIHELREDFISERRKLKFDHYLHKLKVKKFNFKITFATYFTAIKL